MALTKRFLSLAMALLLGLALLIPAAADSSITMEEKKIPPSLVTVFTGDMLKLEIDVKALDGAGEQNLAYAWYDYAYNPNEGETAPPIATGPKLEIPIVAQMVPMGFEIKTYSVAVNRVTADGTDNVACYSSKVYMFISVGQLPALWWGMGLDLAGGDSTIAGFALAMASPVLLLASLFMVPLILAARFLTLFM
ncbi:MAG: hypothetical protein LBB75_00775 [Oscillospiraceae bacterium]|jgi:opacity protein-like surface antigen|nr:hypothetical protein [Oscillospiraceae bacterium]